MGRERIFDCKLYFYTRVAKDLKNGYGYTLQWIVLGLGKNLKYLGGEYLLTLNKKKKYPALININSYKPFNHKLLFNLIKTKNNILIVEDHVSHGGLSSLVYETLAKYGKSKCNVNSLNLDEKFSESGSPADLEKANGFDPKNIAKIINAKKYLAK